METDGATAFFSIGLLVPAEAELDAAGPVAWGVGLAGTGEGTDKTGVVLVDATLVEEAVLLASV